MKKLKNHKKDIVIILLFSAIYIIIALILTRGKYYFASTTDFEMQHYIFPEYFRNLFYDTFDLFPDFALNIGGGQNIYNFSYYGLLNPFILISYLLPMIPMFYYLMGLSFIIVVSSTFLFYKFLESHNFKTSTCLITALLFLFATPIIYHAKRHIMFINYFPFLIGGLFAVDNFIKNKKQGLLILCITLMIFTSFYYSVSGIVMLMIYGIYARVKKEGKKNLIKFMASFIIPFIIAILTSSILLLPTAYTLLVGRGESIKALEWWMLLIPNFHFLFNAYGPGITLLEFILIDILVIDKEIKKEIRILGLLLLIIFIFPIFNYILNGTLYVNSKSLIPFLPLALLLIAVSMETLLKNSNKLKTYLIISTCIITISGSLADGLVSINKNQANYEKEYKSVVEKLNKKDKDFYRIGNQTYQPSSLNRIYTMNEYKNSVYSSTATKKFQMWLQKEIKNNQIYRNNMMLTLAGNPISEAIMGEKYIVSNKKIDSGYTLVDKTDRLYLYKNELALPIIYATNKKLSEKEYKKVEYPKNLIATYTKEIPPDNLFNKVELEIKNTNNIKLEKTEDTVKIRAGKNAKMTLVPKENLNNKVVFISFKNKFNKGCHHEKNDQTITINQTTNKLTCRDWKYHNQNYNFHYVLISPEKLEVTFSKAYYKLGNIEITSIPLDALTKRKEEIVPITIDKEKTKGDNIVGTIEVEKKMNIQVNIPYDKGFKIKVDGKETKYQESIENTMIFKVSKGKHKIEIIYEASWKAAGKIFSFIGIVLWIIVIFCKKRQLIYWVKKADKDTQK